MWASSCVALASPTTVVRLGRRGRAEFSNDESNHPSGGRSAGRSASSARLHYPNHGRQATTITPAPTTSAATQAFADITLTDVNTSSDADPAAAGDNSMKFVDPDGSVNTSELQGMRGMASDGGKKKTLL